MLCHAAVERAGIAIHGNEVHSVHAFEGDVIKHIAAGAAEADDADGGYVFAGDGYGFEFEFDHRCG